MRGRNYTRNWKTTEKKTTKSSFLVKLVKKITKTSLEFSAVFFLKEIAQFLHMLYLYTIWPFIHAYFKNPVLSSHYISFVLEQDIQGELVPNLTNLSHTH